MPEKDNKAIVRRYFEEVWNKGDMRAADEIINYNFSLHAGALNGREALKIYIAEFRSVFPDVNFTILSMSGEDDKVAVSWVLRGASPDKSEPPTTGMGVYRILDGRIIEAWAHTGSTGGPKRLGIVSHTGPGKYRPASTFSLC